MKNKKFKCRLCGSSEYKTALTFVDWIVNARQTQDERKLLAKVIDQDKAITFGDIVACKYCNLLSVSHVCSDKVLQSFYKAYYVNDSYSSKKDSKIRRARKWIKRVLPKGKAKSFLDVGCNLGFAVEAAHFLSLKATGLEIDPEAISRAQKQFPHLEFINGDVVNFSKKGRKFDIVYCSEVFEHVPDFMTFASALKNLVADGGIIFLTTPDAFHWRRPKNLLDWAEIKPPEHLTWFGKQHLKDIFGTEEFQVGFQLCLKPKIKMIAKKAA